MAKAEVLALRVLVTQAVSLPCYLLIPWLNRRGSFKTALPHAALVAYANFFIVDQVVASVLGSATVAAARHGAS